MKPRVIAAIVGLLPMLAAAPCQAREAALPTLHYSPGPVPPEDVGVSLTVESPLRLETLDGTAFFDTGARLVLLPGYHRLTVTYRQQSGDFSVDHQVLSLQAEAGHAYILEHEVGGRRTMKLGDLEIEGRHWEAWIVDQSTGKRLGQGRTNVTGATSPAKGQRSP